MNVRALSEPRHTCTGCGGSCQGVVVRAIDDDERARVAAYAGELGIADAIRDGVLRQEDGRCVFLDEHHRCRIHARWGGAAKPLICRQYPVVVIDTGRERRIGIDPGCYTAWSTRRTGDPVDAAGLGVRKAPADPQFDAQEDAVVRTLARAPNLADALGALIGDPRPGALAALHARWLTRLVVADLAAVIARPEAGPSLRAALAPLAAAVPGWPSPPPAPVLDPDTEAFVVDVARRVLFLRLVPGPPPVATAALVLLGGVALGWVDARPSHVGPGLAAWTRALRAPMFLRALAVDPPTLAALLRG